MRPSERHSGDTESVQAHMMDMHQVSVTKGGRGECVHQRGTVVGTRNLACNTSKVLSQSPKRRGQAAEARLTSLRS